MRDGSTKKPLAAAKFTIREILGASGDMEVVLDLRSNLGDCPEAFWTHLAMMTVNPSVPR